MTQTILQTIYRFPVKGFPGQKLATTSLIAGRGIPHDRRFAVTNGTEDTGEWARSRNFYVNAVCDDMMKHKLEFDGNEITLQNIKGEQITFSIDDVDSFTLANKKITDFMQPIGVQQDLPKPQIIDRQEGAIWDYIDTPISIINAESVKQLGGKCDADLDPARFRGNLIIEGLPAWDEFGWMGKRIKIGETELDVHRPIDRCPTPGVNPETGERDVEVTPLENKHYGHIYCGMYAKVVKGGEIKSGDAIEVIGDAAIKLEETFVSNASAYERWPRMVEIVAYEKNAASTKLSLKATSPWPLPEAKSGQRLRFHLGDQGWTTDYITSASSDLYELEIKDSETNDPITAQLRGNLSQGMKLIISGPYGRA